ncbi:thioredoxin family protein [Enterococcus thailandicus]|uniref:Thioredoxin domain-containing protein n=1 Tax=bioreactor metagenome TaxID=1076179 RepID=A0A645DCJ8_9ZZZZ|nr:thioredoxin family protein [Enterococcus thailandicus]MDK4351507.1 thioredoxin family protein [Enterococcus thailandicus]MDT2733741.1 thioredoxin family protein [Enterococcus thailandicus]
MKKTTQLAEALQLIDTEDTVVLFLSMPHCSVCHAIEPRLQKLLTSFDIPALHLDTHEIPEVASTFEVLTVPVILIFHKGKEIARQARFIDLEKIEFLLTQITHTTDALNYEEIFNTKKG